MHTVKVYQSMWQFSVKARKKWFTLSTLALIWTQLLTKNTLTIGFYLTDKETCSYYHRNTITLNLKYYAFDQLISISNNFLLLLLWLLLPVKILKECIQIKWLEIWKKEKNITSLSAYNKPCTSWFLNLRCLHDVLDMSKF